MTGEQLALDVGPNEPPAKRPSIDAMRIATSVIETARRGAWGTA